MNSYRVLDLFSGIGGFALGLERAGMETVAFCEQDGYARRVLRKHWPDVWLYEDVKTLTAKRLRKDGLDPNVIVGGFPCQDISTAGKGAGIDGARSGLWSEFRRLIREIRPHFAIVENVPAIRSRGLDRVLGDLAEIRYDAEWHCIPASSVGAPHIRDRAWILAYPESFGRQLQGPVVRPRHIQQVRSDFAGQGDRVCPEGPEGGISWEREPRIERVVDGVPCQVDRLRCLGNAVVPLIPELIGRAIIEYESAHAVAI